MEAKIYMKHGPISFSPLITVLALKAPMRYAIYRERLMDAFTDGYVKTKYFFYTDFHFTVGSGGFHRVWTLHLVKQFLVG